MDTSAILSLIIRAKNEAGPVLNAVGQAVVGIRKSTNEMYKAFTSVKSLAVTGLGLAGVGLSARALVGEVKALVDELEALNNTAQNLGIDPQEFLELDYAARAAGQGSEVLRQALARLDVLTSENAEALTKLGLSLDGLTATEKLKAIAAALAGIGNQADRTNAATEIFGAKLAQRILPVLNSDLDESARRFGSLGGVIVSQAIPAALDVGNAFDELDLSLKAVKAQLLITFGPELTEGLKGIATLVSANRDEIVASIRDFAPIVVEIIAGIIVGIGAVADVIAGVVAIAKAAFVPLMALATFLRAEWEILVTGVDMVGVAIQTLVPIGEGVGYSLKKIFATLASGAVVLAKEAIKIVIDLAMSAVKAITSAFEQLPGGAGRGIAAMSKASLAALADMRKSAEETGATLKFFDDAIVDADRGIAESSRKVIENFDEIDKFHERVAARQQLILDMAGLVKESFFEVGDYLASLGTSSNLEDAMALATKLKDAYAKLPSLKMPSKPRTTDNDGGDQRELPVIGGEANAATLDEWAARIRELQADARRTVDDAIAGNEAAPFAEREAAMRRIVEAEIEAERVRYQAVLTEQELVDLAEARRAALDGQLGAMREASILSSNDLFAGMGVGFQQLQDDFKLGQAGADAMRDAFGALQSQTASFFQSLMDGSMSAQDAFKQFVQGLISSLIGLVAQLLATIAVAAILNVLLGGIPAGIGAIGGGAGLLGGVGGLFGGGGGGERNSSRNAVSSGFMAPGVASPTQSIVQTNVTNIQAVDAPSFQRLLARNSASVAETVASEGNDNGALRGLLGR